MKDLQRFCAHESDPRGAIKTPFAICDFAYATNGKIMVCRLIEDGEEGADEARENKVGERLAGSIQELAVPDPAREYATGEYILPPKTKCPKCGGSRVVSCEYCYGSGEHECECGDEHSCAACAGDKETDCSKCDDGFACERTYVLDLMIDSKFVYWIQALDPDGIIEFARGTPRGTWADRLLYFRVGKYHGAIMGMREN